MRRADAYCLVLDTHEPCYVGPRVSDGGDGDGFQIWRKVVTNVLNKQSWISEKGWSFGLEFGRGAKNSSP